MPMLTVTKDGNYKLPRPKKTRQGRSARTLLSATSRNKAKKAYRGQGRQMKNPWIHKKGKSVLDKRSKQYKGKKKKGKKK